MIYFRKTCILFFLLVMSISRLHGSVINVSIDSIKKVDSNGVPLLINDSVQITGVVQERLQVYGINSLFYCSISDSSGSIMFLNNPRLTYLPRKGDKITLKSLVSQMPHKKDQADTGTTIILADSHVVVISKRNSLNHPVKLMQMQEKDEATYVELDSMKLLNPKAWNPTEYNPVEFLFGKYRHPGIIYHVKLVPGLMTIPSSLVNLKGFVLQNDGSKPYTSGYYLFIWNDSDVISLNYHPEIPKYNISQVKGYNSYGMADSATVYCELQGIVQSEQCYYNKTFFSIFDSNGSISVMDQSSNWGYSPHLGDSIHIRGVVSQNTSLASPYFYTGLTFIGPDSIWIIPGSYKAKAPVAITDYDEQYESQLVTLKNVDYLCCWDTTGNPTGFQPSFYAPTNKYLLWILQNSVLYSHPAPVSGTYNVTGILTQWDDPRNKTLLSHYYLMPRDTFDIVLSSTTGVKEQEASISNIKVFPNPLGENNTFTIEMPLQTNSKENIRIDIVDSRGMQVETQKAASVITKSTTSEYSFNYNHLKQSLYMLRIKNSTEILGYVKLLVGN